MKIRLIFISCLFLLISLVIFLKMTNHEAIIKKSPFDESFTLQNLTITANRGPSLVITDRVTLSKIQHLVNHSNTSFLEINAIGAYTQPIVCMTVFLDQNVIEYYGSLKFYSNCAYLSINLNLDEGWMSGPTVDMRLDTELEPSVLEELRKTFPKNPDQIQEWKPPIEFENSGSQP